MADSNSMRVDAATQAALTAALLAAGARPAVGGRRGDAGGAYNCQLTLPIT